ncbi:MAG: NAD-dependent epimerase/dehydratase family protein [Acidobacteriota bacterium]
MSRYLVTGATGFIGAEIVKQLVGRGHRVSALVRTLDRTAMLRALGVDLHVGDITDAASLRPAMEGVDGVFHLAAWYRLGPRSPVAERVNVEGTRLVLEAMRDAGVPKGVYASTLSVLGDTGGVLADERFVRRSPFLSEYERTKWKAHHEVALPMARAGLPLVIAMPGAVYGPGDTSGIHDLIVRLLQKRLPMVPRGTAFCWGYIEDTARGFVQAMEAGRPGEAYVIAGPVHPLDEALRLAARIAGVRPPVVNPPPISMRIAAGLAGAAERIGLRLPYSAEALRLMSGVTWIASSAKAARELGFRARPLEEGWGPTIEHEKRRLGLS